MTALKIAFTSCMSTASYPTHQKVWDTIAAQQPDVLVLLGDSVYIDCPPKPDSAGLPHPSDVGYLNRDFGEHLYSLYQRQLEIPEFSNLIKRSDLQTFAIWDDHDFLFNDACESEAHSNAHTGQAVISANLFKLWRQALSGHGVGFATGLDDGRIFANSAPPYNASHYDTWMPGYQCVPLRSDASVLLHLTDGRSWRRHGLFQSHRLLNPDQKKQIEKALDDAPDALHLLASGSTFNGVGFKLETWTDFPEDAYWLLQLANRYKIVMLSGDIHQTAFPQPVYGQGATQPLYEVTASGAAVNFNPFIRGNRDPGPVIGNFTQKFGLLTIADGQSTSIQVQLFEDGQPLKLWKDRIDF